MKNIEKEQINNYPEAAAFAGLAVSVWNGSASPAKIEMVVKGRLHAELKKLLDKDVQTVFLTDSDIRHIKKNMEKMNRQEGRLILPLMTLLLFRLF